MKEWGPKHLSQHLDYFGYASHSSAKYTSFFPSLSLSSWSEWYGSFMAYPEKCCSKLFETESFMCQMAAEMICEWHLMVLLILRGVFNISTDFYWNKSILQGDFSHWIYSKKLLIYYIRKTTAGNAPINRHKQMDSDKSVNYSHSFLANILLQSQLANVTSETNM